MPSALVSRYALDASRITLNHGSFGACLKSTLKHQDALRAELEADPTGFFEHRFPVYLADSRERLASALGADGAGMVFVTNATMGVSTVLHSLALKGHFARGDELLTTDHVYPACFNALAAYAERAGAKTIAAKVPFPIASPDEVERAVLDAVTERTKLVLLDHVTSPTGLVFPIERLVKTLEARGIPVLIDGAHAPGMIPVDLRALGASFYTANLHKWLSAPKAAALLWAREDRRADLRPLVVSHGHGLGLLAEFDWTGTFDPTALFSVGAALDGFTELHPGGMAAVMTEGHAMALRAQATLCDALGIAAPAPASMIGALVAVPLPPLQEPLPKSLLPGAQDPDRVALEAALNTRVPFFPWPFFTGPDARHRLLRISLAPYVSDDDVKRLADWLRARFG
jgi:isopenicillin-N epimerase